MPPTAYCASGETELPGGTLRQTGRHAGRRNLAAHPALLFNSFARGTFLVTAGNGRRAASPCTGTTLSGFFHAFASEDHHDA